MHIIVPRFTVGWMLVTPAALVALVEAQEDPKTFIYRHMKGDWGDVGPEGWAENEYAVRHGERLFSIYHTRHGRKLHVLTEANRYATMILLPEELREPSGKESLMLSGARKQEFSKLDKLADQWALTVGEFIEEYALDSTVPGICMNPDCLYTTQVEPDQRQAWCEVCGTTTVRSGIVLAGLI